MPSFYTRFTKVGFRNFRCFGELTEVPLKPLTILIGPNNSGKSTILSALSMMKQTLDSPVPDPVVLAGPYVDLGTFQDLKNKGTARATDPVEVSFQVETKGGYPFVSLQSEDRDKGDKIQIADARFGFNFDPRRRRMVLRSSRLALNGHVEAEAVSSRGRLVLEGVPEAIRKKAVIHPVHCFPTFHVRKGLPKNLQNQAAKMSQRTYELMYGWGLIFSGVTPISPVRSALPRLTFLGRSVGQAAGSGGEETLLRLASDIRIGPDRRTLEWLVNSWVTSKLLMLQRIHLDRLDRAKTVVSLRGDERGGPKGINLASMGKGFSQVLPILTGVLGGNFDDCVLIEQPELHLHPRLQAELGDLFVDQLMHGWIHQFIIETHSEHLLLRIRRRVAEREIPAEMVGVLVVEREGSKTNVTPLSMKPDGYFDNWPKGFFEEGVKEAYALASAKGAGE